MTYEEFIKSKEHSISNHGIETNFIPELMFDYQEYVLNYSVKKGRAAIFLDTGLGKPIVTGKQTSIQG